MLRRLCATASLNEVVLIRPSKWASSEATATGTARFPRRARCADEHIRTLVSLMSSNDEVERRGNAPTSIEADLSQSSTASLSQRRCGPAIARTDCQWEAPNQSYHRHDGETYCKELSYVD